MLKSHLSLDISNSFNPKVIRLFDTSHYCKDENIENLLVEVLPANGLRWVTFAVSVGFSLVLNSSNLRYSVVSNTSDLIDLPDGIYELKISFKPNDQTVRHFYHFRVVALVKRLKEELTKLLAEECKLQREEFISNRNKLREVEEYLEAAVYMVEEESDKAKGKELYQWAEKLLEEYSHACKC